MTKACGSGGEHSRRSRALWQATMRTPRHQRGQATLEFVLTLPFFLTLLFTAIALAIGGMLALFTGAMVPVEVRDQAVGVGAGGRLEEFSATTGAGAPGVSEAEGCQRAVYGAVSSTYGLGLPYVDAWLFSVQAGSVSRNWRFWAGPPEDGCQ